jgi:hypothetical protein
MYKLCTRVITNLRIICPICRVKTIVTDCHIESRLFRHFPVNRALVSLMQDEPKVSTDRHCCWAHSSVVTHLCLKESCIRLRKCCETCILQLHANCDKSYIVDLSDVTAQIEIDYEKSVTLQTKHLFKQTLDYSKSALSSFMSKLEKQYSTFFDRFVVQEASLDPARPQFDPYLVSMFKVKRESPNDAFLRMRVYNYPETRGLMEATARFTACVEKAQRIFIQELDDNFHPMFESLRHAKEKMERKLANNKIFPECRHSRLEVIEEEDIDDRSQASE